MRVLSTSEASIVAKLVRAASRSDEVAELRVNAMNDGGMGSLQFESSEKSQDRRFGGIVSEARFTDSDGVLVHVAIIRNNHSR